MYVGVKWEEDQVHPTLSSAELNFFSLLFRENAVSMSI